MKSWHFDFFTPLKDWLIVLSLKLADASITQLDVFQAKKVHEKVIDMVLAQNQVAALAVYCVYFEIW